LSPSFTGTDYSKPSPIRSNWGEVIWINEVNVALKDKLRTQVSGKFGDTSSADKTDKNITVEPLFKNYKKQ
jgi:hypothetical protein